ncbi:MAG: SGNH/GDSL hydrolase family protein [Anaerolineae bacterium]|nr:SGNH/GDSL hydrolase family protein [Anaerolineae bacterium]
MKIINVVGDSLSLVRPAEGIRGDDLYWMLLQERLGPPYYVVAHSRRSNDTAQVVRTMHEDILAFPMFALVLHLGIVDCFPRLFSKREHDLLHVLTRLHLGTITRTVTRLAARHRLGLTRRFQKHYVSLPDFTHNLHTIMGAVQGCNAAQHIILLGILDTSAEKASRTYQAVESIRAYDAVLRRMTIQYPCVHYIDLNGYFKAQGITPTLPDGHHLSPAAHPHVAALLEATIRRLE